MHQKQLVNAQFSTQVVQFTKNCLQCFDTVGRVAGRAPGRAVARILFQPRQRGKPGVRGPSPQRGPGAEPLVSGSGGKAP